MVMWAVHGETHSSLTVPQTVRGGLSLSPLEMGLMIFQNN